MPYIRADEMQNVGNSVAGFVASIIGLAILAVVLSQRSATVSVLSAFFGGLTQLVSAAVAPVSGGAVVSSATSGLASVVPSTSSNLTGLIGSVTGGLVNGVANGLSSGLTNGINTMVVTPSGSLTPGTAAYQNAIANNVAGNSSGSIGSPAVDLGAWSVN